MSRPDLLNDEASDEALAVSAAGGERAAFEELVERYGGAVVALFERRLGDPHDALDLAQEIWVKVFRALGGFRPDGSFRSWLFAIALNAVRDEGRRRQRARVVYLDEFRGEGEGETSSTEEASDERREIDVALASVDEPFRTALVLIDLEGLAYDEAAASLGCAVGTVKSRVARGRRAFREEWNRRTGSAVTLGDTT